MAIDKPALPPPTLAQYPELILGAIEAVDSKNGANTEAISKHIEAMYGELPAAHSTLLSHHLNKMKQTGELVMYKNNYLRPDPTRTSRRGPGRPPKERVVVVSGDAASAPRKRGRPAKSGGLVGDLTPRPRGRPKSGDREAKLPATVSARPRGRPAKVVDPTGSLRLNRPRGRPVKAKIVALPLQGRGRPAKRNDSNAAKISRPRGRPPKNANAAVPPSTSPRPRGRPPKNVVPENAVTLLRPRGRPPKKNVDGEGSVSLPETNSPSLSGRKRGRPKKIEKSGNDEMMNSPALQSSGTKRGRGRPPKAKQV